jgi:hypothetical protein
MAKKTKKTTTKIARKAPTKSKRNATETKTARAAKLGSAVKAKSTKTARTAKTKAAKTTKVANAVKAAKSQPGKLAKSVSAKLSSLLDRRLLDIASKQYARVLREVKKGKKIIDDETKVAIQLGERIIAKAREVKASLTK